MVTVTGWGVDLNYTNLPRLVFFFCLFHSQIRNEKNGVNGKLLGFQFSASKPPGCEVLSRRPGERSGVGLWLKLYPSWREWMVYFMENPIEMGWFGGFSPYFWKHPSGFNMFQPFSRWWQLKYFWNFHPDPWGCMIQFDFRICFRWVEAWNHQLEKESVVDDRFP